MNRNLRIRMLLEAADRATRPLRDLTGGSRRAADALQATRDRLTQLNRAQRDIGDFRQLRTGLNSTQRELDQARQRATALGRALGSTTNPTRQMRREFDQARRAAQELERRHADETRQLQQLRQRLRDAGISTNDLARHERELRRDISRTNQEMQEQTRRLQQLQARQQRMADARAGFARAQGVATGMTAGGFAAIQTARTIAAPLLGSIEEAQKYESVMTDIAQKADLSRKHGERMGAGLLNAARAANQLPAALQQGVDALAGFGLDPRQATQMMAPIGRAATAYKAEIADLSSAAFAAHDNLKVPVAQTGRMIDIMAQAGKSGAFEIKDMAQYFPTLTAGYQALGQQGVSAVADLSAALQIARKGAGDSATAATNVANVIQKISSPATIKAFSKFGVDLPAALKKAYAEGKTPLEGIAELTNKALGGDMSKLGFLFEDAQVQQGLRPLIANMEEYRRIRAEAGSATGVTDTDFAERMKDSAEQSRRWAVNSQILAITLGAKLMPTVNSVLEKANAFANWVGALATKHPMATKAILIGVAAFAALFAVVGGGALVMAALVAPFAALSFAAAALGVGLLPIIGIAAAVVAGVVALGAAAYLIYQNWGAVTGFFSRLWSGVKSIFATAWADIKTAFDGGLWGVLAMLVKWGGSALITLWNIGAALMPKLWAALSAGVAWAIGAAPGLFSGLMTGIKNVIWNGLLLIPRLAVQFGVNTVQGFVNGMLSMFGFLKKGITGMATSAVTWFKEKLGIHSPSRVFAGFGVNVVQGLSNGIASEEDGPVRRLDRLSRRMTSAIAVGSIAGTVPLAAAATPAVGGASGGAGGPGPVEIHIHPPAGSDEAKIAELVRRAIEDLRAQEAAQRRSSYIDQPDYGDRY